MSGLFDTRGDRRCLAKIPPQSNCLTIGIAIADSLNDLPRIVRGAIIHKYYLQLITVVFAGLRDISMQRCQALAFIKQWNHDG